MNRLMIALLVGVIAIPAAAQEKQSEKSITARTAGLQKLNGYIPLYWDAATGKMLMEISRFNVEFLYQISLPTGVGSNPLGLDRGQLGGSHVVRFERIGPKVLLIQSNYRYRAISPDVAERRAVEESFAQSVLWGFKVEASESDRVLVDATGFFLRDAHGVLDRLRQARQGQYRYDDSRSAFYLPRTRVFPMNTEVETILTFTSEAETGPLVRDTVPSPGSLTVREHHSLVELPDNNYKPRKLDPRVGVHGISFYDYASPFTEPVEKRWISRHRLQKKDPGAAISEPVKPIVYYVDNGAPEPIRSALVEGASWWNAAFEAAGFKNAFQVKILPEGADPMDLRYNMINWVHRSSRGWSYGGSVTDPRTGEIIKGNVTLGSLRIRQDYMIGTGLIPLFAASAQGEGECEFGAVADLDYLTDLDPSTDAAAMSLARIRQLSAHETGHTLGLAHNFAASTYGRASVMDYPAPTVEIKNGKLDLSNAYAVGIGAYDKFAIKYGYSEFAPGSNEQSQLERILEDGVAAGMLFISDADSRPPGAAHPLSNLWDNGSDPIAMLRHEMEVRKIGLSQFGLNSVPVGTPLSLLEAKLLPLYLHHRYQLQAAVKSVGGVYYTYAVKTAAGANPGKVQEIVPPKRQRDALAAVLETIEVDALAIPSRILEMIPPRAFGYEGGTTELFSKRTAPTFDPVAAATIAADIAIGGLLDPNRAARLIDFHARNNANPDFKEVVDALVGATWKAAAPKNAYHAEIGRAVQSLTVTELMDLAADSSAAPQVRAVAAQALRELSGWLKLPASAGLNAAHRSATREDIERFLTRPDATRKQTPPLAAPPGDPIGSKSSRN
ncbi:MAG TPA: zinc-dependent metalloprotease [Blastocatellia bacterium]|nr:zinc-dependent metalloprotease [Blastocatellia bacterium]